jgi:hypothetical protein
MAFIALTYPLQWGLHQLTGSTSAGDLMVLWLYPLRIIAVLLVLIYFRPVYTELHAQVWRSWQELVLSICIGILVYVLWVRMDWPWAIQGQASSWPAFASSVPPLSSR